MNHLELTREKCKPKCKMIQWWTNGKRKQCKKCLNADNLCDKPYEACKHLTKRNIKNKKEILK